MTEQEPQFGLPRDGRAGFPPTTNGYARNALPEWSRQAAFSDWSRPAAAESPLRAAARANPAAARAMAAYHRQALAYLNS